MEFRSGDPMAHAPNIEQKPPHRDSTPISLQDNECIDWNSVNRFESEALCYRERRRTFWKTTADSSRKSWGSYYRKRLLITYKNLVPEGSTVLEVGCAGGDLLAALKPAKGVGIDFCMEVLEKARTRHPQLVFLQADAHDLDITRSTFDYIIISELVNDL